MFKVAADPPGSLFSELPQQPVESLVAFRYSSYDVPFWVRPNSRAGRWNSPGDPPTQYWSLTPDGAWAELVRFEDLRSESELDEVRIATWVCRLPSMRLIDLREPSACSQYGLDPRELTADDWSKCQIAGKEIRNDGARGLLAPSAALANTVNVTLFGPRRAIAFDRTPALASAVPAAIVAIGRPPRNLVGRVVRRTTPLTLF